MAGRVRKGPHLALWSRDPYEFGVDWEDLDAEEAIELFGAMPAAERRLLRLFAAAPDSVRRDLINRADEAASRRSERSRARRTG